MVLPLEPHLRGSHQGGYLKGPEGNGSLETLCAHQTCKYDNESSIRFSRMNIHKLMTCKDWMSSGASLDCCFSRNQLGHKPVGDLRSNTQWLPQKFICVTARPSHECVLGPQRSHAIHRTQKCFRQGGLKRRSP